MAYPGQGGHHYQQTSGGGGYPGQGYPQQGYPQQGYGPPQPNPYGGGYGQPPPPSGGMQGQMGYGYGAPSGPVGPQAYASNNVHHQPQGGMIGNQRYEYSNMQGKRKALLIGINYFGQSSELRGCINDVKNVKQFLTRHGYQEDDMVVLTDDQRDPRSIPTDKT